MPAAKVAPKPVQRKVVTKKAPAAKVSKPRSVETKVPADQRRPAKKAPVTKSAVKRAVPKKSPKAVAAPPRTQVKPTASGSSEPCKSCPKKKVDQSACKNCPKEATSQAREAAPSVKRPVLTSALRVPQPGQAAKRSNRPAVKRIKKPVTPIAAHTEKAKRAAAGSKIEPPAVNRPRHIPPLGKQSQARPMHPKQQGGDAPWLKLPASSGGVYKVPQRPNLELPKPYRMESSGR
jgi:DnaK suppressor protein